MATIQFNVTDEEFKELLKLSDEKTGTKALWFIIDQFKRQRVELAALKRDHHDLTLEHEELQSKVAEFSTLLNYFNRKNN
jgi:hypothetical protein